MNWTWDPIFTEYLSEVLNCKVMARRDEKFEIQSFILLNNIP